MNIRLVLSGRHYDTVDALPNSIELPDEATLDDALDALDRLLPEDVSLPESCLLAVSGRHLGTKGSHPQETLADGDELMLIAPVAGG